MQFFHEWWWCAEGEGSGNCGSASVGFVPGNGSAFDVCDSCSTDSMRSLHGDTEVQYLSGQLAAGGERAEVLGTVGAFGVLWLAVRQRSLPAGVMASTFWQ